MEDATHDNLSIDNLVDQAKAVRHKRITREAVPTIRRHKAFNSTWYTYCHGRGPEIYLGTADSILEAVQAYKLASGKNRRSKHA